MLRRTAIINQFIAGTASDVATAFTSHAVPCVMFRGFRRKFRNMPHNREPMGHRPSCTWSICVCYCGRGSVLLWRACSVLCSSGFVDDVTHNGPDTDTGLESATWVNSYPPWLA